MRPRECGFAHCRSRRAATGGPDVDPRTAELSRRLAASRLDLENAVTSVPPAERSVSPGEGRWSVAQVLEHLSIVDASRPRTASAASQPTGLDADAAARRLAETRGALLRVLERAEGRALDQAR